MLGGAPISARPMSDVFNPVLPATVLAAVNQVPVYTLELYSPTTDALIIPAATEQYLSLPTDVIGNVQFNGRLNKALTFRRSIVSSKGFGQVSIGIGELELDNADGFYDSLISQPLDGAGVVLKMVWRGGSYNDAVTLFAGFADNGFVNEKVLRLHLQDDSAKLDVPVQPSTYGGTGGADGDSSISGKRKPIGLGHVHNATGALINAGSLVYQLTDPAVAGNNLVNVYTVLDNGASLALGGTGTSTTYAQLVAEALSPGQFGVCYNLGLVRLASTPAGDVTFEFRTSQSATSTVIVDSAAAVQILMTAAAPGVTLDRASIARTTLSQPAEIGYFISHTEDKSLRQAVDDIMTGIGGWGAFKRDRTFQVGITDASFGTSVASYLKIDVGDGGDGGFARIPLPDGVDPPPWRRRGRCQVNYTILNNLAGVVVDSGGVLLYTDPFVSADSDNVSLSATIRAAHKTAPDPPVDQTYFESHASAVTEMNRLLSLYGATYRSLFEFTLPSRAFIHEIGDVITVTYDRFDLTTGKQFNVVGTDDDSNTGRVKVTAFG